MQRIRIIVYRPNLNRLKFLMERVDKNKRDISSALRNHKYSVKPTFVVGRNNTSTFIIAASNYFMTV